MTTTKAEKADTAAKKDVQKLQRAIVDGLEDVKAQDIQVFNTEHLSPLFERVVIASGTSNRQTKALAASVRDAVREAGFAKPRIEGEDNGEWIIVDCGPAVAHIMQPTIRQYYRLEEIWGEMPVRLKLGAPKPAATAPKKTAPVKTAKTTKTAAAPAAGKRPPAKKAAPRKTAAGAAPAKKPAGKSTATQPGAKAGTRTAAKSRVAPKAKTLVVNKPGAKKASSKTAASKTTARQHGARPAARKPAAR